MHAHIHPHMHAHRQAGMHTPYTNAIKRINRISRALCFLQIKISALYRKIVVGCLIRFSPAPQLLTASLYFTFCLYSSQAFWRNVPDLKRRSLPPQYHVHLPTHTHLHTLPPAHTHLHTLPSTNCQQGTRVTLMESGRGRNTGTCLGVCVRCVPGVPRGSQSYLSAEDELAWPVDWRRSWASRGQPGP